LVTITYVKPKQLAPKYAQMKTDGFSECVVLDYKLDLPDDTVGSHRNVAECG